MSPSIRVDFSQPAFEPLPESAYHVAITGCKSGVGRESGKPYLNWEFTVQDGDYTGRKLWLITSLAPKANFRLKQLLESVGASIPSAEIDVDPSEYIGRELTLTVIHQVYSSPEGDKIQDRVDKLMALQTPSRRSR